MAKNKLAAIVVAVTALINLLGLFLGVPQTVSCTVSGVVQSVHAAMSTSTPE